MWSTSCTFRVLLHQRPNPRASVYFKQTAQATSDLSYTPGSPPGLNRVFFRFYNFFHGCKHLNKHLLVRLVKGGAAETAESQPSINGWRIQNHVATRRTVSLQSVLYFWCWPLPEAVSVLQSDCVILLLWNFPLRSRKLWQHIPHPRKGTIDL